MGFNIRVITKRKAFYVNVKETIFENFLAFVSWIFERYASHELNKGSNFLIVFKYHLYRILEIFVSKSNFTIIRDPEIIRKIMVDDFDKFSNRMNMFDDKLDRIYAQTLPVLRDQEWRDVKARVSPFFCEKNIQGMYKSITTCVDSFLGYLNEISTDEPQIISSKHILARFTSSVIATCCLGLNIDSEKHESAYRVALRLTNCFGFLGKMKIALMTFIPKIYRALRLQLMDTQTREFFERAIVDEMRRRHEQNILKADMIQYLNENFGDSSEETLIAQCVVFFGAGFETTTNLLQMMCYELAKNENVQRELADEIEKVNLELSGKRVSFETLDKMSFLDCVVMETLRLWPPSFNIDRSCTANCNLVGDEGMVYEFKENDQIIVPVHEIHRDERFFENPNDFVPRRFENRSRIIPGTFLPYGMGARCCLGQKFSTLVVKLLIFHLLGCYRVKLCDKFRSECDFEQPLTFTKLKKSKSTNNLLK